MPPIVYGSHGTLVSDKTPFNLVTDAGFFGREPASDHPHSVSPGPAGTAPGSIEFQPMARLIFGIALFFMLFAQATIVPQLNPLTVSPDIVLLMLFLMSAFRGAREGLAWVFVVGIVADIVAMDPLGTNGLALLPAVVFAGPARERVFQSNVLIPLALVVVVTIAHGVLLSLLRGVMPDFTTVLQALMHAVLVPFFYLALRWLA